MSKTLYEPYKHNKIWKIIEQTIRDLENNQDIELKTSSDYVVGLIVKRILEIK